MKVGKKPFFMRDSSSNSSSSGNNLNKAGPYISPRQAAAFASERAAARAAKMTPGQKGTLTKQINKLPDMFGNINMTNAAEDEQQNSSEDKQPKNKKQRVRSPKVAAPPRPLNERQLAALQAAIKHNADREAEIARGEQTKAEKNMINMFGKTGF